MPLHTPGPLTYSGALWRVLRTRRRLRKKGLRRGLTPLLLLTLVLWWFVVTLWYPFYSVGRVLLWAVGWERWNPRRKRRKTERQARRDARKSGA